MKVILAILKQEAFGILKFSFPIMLFAHHAPDYFYPLWGQLLCSFVVGFYVFYVTYVSTQNSAKVLQFAPTTHKELFHTITRVCNIDPETINFRYGYSGEGLAMTLMRTISIDPLIFQELEIDMEACNAKDVLERYLMPTMSDLQKKRIDQIKEIVTPHVLPFIVKHELGHVYHNYAYKKTTLTGTIGMVTAFSGISIAIGLYNVIGHASLLVAMISAGLIDLFLTYGSNYFFKMPEEKRADFFAAQHCSAEELSAAADFFEQHQDILEKYKDDTVLSKLPSVLLSGHPDGKVRAEYLRGFMKRKSMGQERIA